MTTFLDDILGPQTEGEKHIQSLPKPGDQEWLDEVSNSAWFRARTANEKGGLRTLTIDGGSETTTQEYLYEEDPYFEEEEDEEWTERGVEL